MNEERIYETLDVTQESEGGKEQALAAPAPDRDKAVPKGGINTAAESGAGGSAGERKNGEADASSSANADDAAKRARADAAARRRREEQRAAIDRAVDDALAREREKVRRERDEAAAKETIEAELREIHRLDPSVSTAEDLLKMPSAREFYEYVRRGNTFLDAFYLANRSRLTAAAAETARQQAMNASRSKDHLHPAGFSRGAGADSVPAEEMRYFKLLNPNASEAEIQKYYNRSRSRSD